MTVAHRIRSIALAVILAAVSGTALGVECANTDYALSSRADVELLGLEDCDEIIGDLRISGSADIVDLEPLSRISIVGGTITVGNNDTLTSLDGLSGIISLGGRLRVFYNPNLVSLAGLSGISTVNGDMLLVGNENLTNLDGLSSIVSVEGNLVIGETFLASLDGLSGLRSVAGRVTIDGNKLLANVDGLSGLTSVGANLTIQNNPLLASLSGLSGVKSVDGSITIANNDILMGVDGLSGLISVGGSLSFRDNPVLASLSGLAGIESLEEGSLLVANNNNLASLDGLPFFSRVSGLVISRNSSLTDCSAVAPLLGWPAGENNGVMGNLSIDSNQTGCNSIAEILSPFTGPTAPLVSESSAGNGSIEMAFSSSLTSDLDFPIEKYTASCSNNVTRTGINIETKPIPNKGFVTSALTISGTSTDMSHNIYIEVDVSHVWRADLELILTSPSGTKATLWAQSGGVQSHLVGTFPTTLSPAQSLDVFEGESFNGEWVLTVADGDHFDDTGVLNSWRMEVKSAVKSDSLQSPILVAGLMNGESYECTVSAVTKLGEGPASSTITATPSHSLPTPPLITTIEPDEEELRVSFTSDSDGGSPITNYTVTCGGVSATGSTSPITLTGLSGDQTYSCTVVATNIAGTSPPSSAVSGRPSEKVILSGLSTWMLIEARRRREGS
ncbi:MAG: proprotein convertase P-domain-containing protein [Halioglobus sp.]